MSVYNDMANDAGYKFGTDENRQMAEMIEEDERRNYEEQIEKKRVEETEQNKKP